MVVKWRKKVSYALLEMFRFPTLMIPKHTQNALKMHDDNKTLLLCV